jgi:hypothetical protein
VGARGWIALTQDQLRASPEEQQALVLHGVKVFVFIGKASHARCADLLLEKIKQVESLIDSHQEAFLARISVTTGEINVQSASTILEKVARMWKRHKRKR